MKIWPLKCQTFSFCYCLCDMAAIYVAGAWTLNQLPCPVCVEMCKKKNEQAQFWIFCIQRAGLSPFRDTGARFRFLSVKGRFFQPARSAADITSQPLGQALRPCVVDRPCPHSLTEISRFVVRLARLLTRKLHINFSLPRISICYKISGR